MFQRDDPRVPPRAFLRRRSSLPVWADLAWRVGAILILATFVLLVHWFERDGLRDNLDGEVSFGDVVYFTAVTVTTVGYGDIVPVTDRTRLFESIFVTPARIFVWLIFLGTAYQFVFRNVWHRWRMSQIQKSLTNHIIVAGFGTSGSEAVRELVARGTDPRCIVVIERSDESLALAEAAGCNILKGDATRDQTLMDVRVQEAQAMIVSAGRDDTSILVTLTARHLAPDIPLSVVVRAPDNESLARQAGATTVINPVSFAGLLLAGSCQGAHIADYMADLAASGGRVQLRERRVTQAEVGEPLSAIQTGLGVRLYRAGRAYGFWEPEAAMLYAGDMIIEIIPNDGETPPSPSPA
ncbi:voltage-gated potassium channel [Sphingobium sp. B2D3A]|uniref:potassium channel family protein n=1 Tax=unclassified Sphingobium TaxID=2611147 RepID=UPI0022254765|nr:MULTISPECIES: potassium channel family protein [unclassified Sphingobium]MCW2338941.1 voltage-gated potassium channel [Sphingobium sp. B2D3A]MCW2385366.1 voltage-gated potassium channel [Sphingobium sp. B2D3D]